MIRSKACAAVSASAVRMAMSASPAVQKAIAKLRSSLQQGQPYDGQQMFKTIYHRFRAQKKLQDCYNLLEEGARLQLQDGQLNCGVELAQMLVEAYIRDNASCSRDNMQRVLYIIDAFPRPQTDADGRSDAVEQCSKVMMSAIKWAKRHNNAATTVQKLHDKLAAYMWECLGWRGLGQVSQHYIRGTDMTGFAAALAQSASEGAPEEEDLFLTRAALQFLAVGKPNNLDQKLEEVQELLQSYESIARHGLPDTPLIHFLKLLVKALEHHSLKLAEMLQQTYSTSLARDSSFVQLLQRIKEIYLGASSNEGLPNLLSGMLQMLTSNG